MLVKHKLAMNGVELGKDVMHPLSSSGCVSCVQMRENEGWLFSYVDQ